MSGIDKEKIVVAKMVELYCRDHHCGDNLCSQCRELMDYAHQRLTHCPQGENKPSCRRCTIHCYSPLHREGIARVMRYSGPRMLLRYPLITLRHLLNL